MPFWDADPGSSVRQAVRWIAQHGGFFAREGDGELGIIPLWRGGLVEPTWPLCS